MQQKKTKFVIGSRESELALIQTNFIKNKLEAAFPDFEFSILSMTTTGDRILNQPLQKIGEKALFTKDLEVAMQNNECDFIVHSLKDLPTVLPDGMMIGAITERESPFDCVVMKSGSAFKSLSDLPKNSRIGTSSVRRKAQLIKKFPDFEYVDIRGNLNTRLQKLDTLDMYDAIILAVAGLERLGRKERITQVLTESTLCYAVGQGALAIECMQSDEQVLGILQVLRDEKTTLRCNAERAFMRILEGGCSIPLGVSTFFGDNNSLNFTGTITSLDGQKQLKVKEIAYIKLGDDPKLNEILSRDLGSRAAHNIIAKGGQTLLDEIKNSTSNPTTNLKSWTLSNEKSISVDIVNGMPMAKVRQNSHQVLELSRQEVNVLAAILNEIKTEMH